ncbi:MAG: RNA-binding transcriptional accessory protein [Clostridiales bacterium]|nr:RNA-binding transcriptional accessory protein [Clostridiales bacterium]
MDIQRSIEIEFGIRAEQAANTIKLFDEGATVPFVARYRKEMTGSLDDQTLRDFYERLRYLRGFEETRTKYAEAIAEQGKLTDELSAAFAAARTLAELEDIYRPFRPKRRTRASIAKERGLEPLADIIHAQKLEKPAEDYAAAFVDPELGVETAADAVAGALDIIAERISDDADIRGAIRRKSQASAKIVSAASDPDKESVYRMYYEYQESVLRIAEHRVLALNRGEREGFIAVKLEQPDDEITGWLDKKLNRRNAFAGGLITAVCADAYKRLIAPSIEREIRSGLTEKAEEGAIRVFGENLKQLLMQPPLKGRTILALDPGYRTGCKFAALDPTGKVLSVGVVYPTPPAKRVEESKAKLIPIIERYGVEVIAIGNGTASRETEAFAAELISGSAREIRYCIVSEAGASVYSASKLGAEEFPEYDVALRSAVSIGRRLQDPLAELVKIEPKAVGVGQYQHDMNQKRLAETLAGVVESCVNRVGVELNTASAPLLGYVAGVSSAVAKNIVAYREANGPFRSRAQLIKVPKLGPKAFEQCAGFLRVADGDEPLDATGVHPESYGAARALIQKIGGSDGLPRKISDPAATALELGVGLPTLLDIIADLEKPGRDPRDEMPPVALSESVLSIDDILPGMVLTGTVRNVIDFGAFIDIGVHQDGLAHISQISKRRIKHPLEALSVGDIVKVKVLAVDKEKNRISLSVKDAE